MTASSSNNMTEKVIDKCCLLGLFISHPKLPFLCFGLSSLGEGGRGGRRGWSRRCPYGRLGLPEPHLSKYCHCLEKRQKVEIICFLGHQINLKGSTTDHYQSLCPFKPTMEYYSSDECQTHNIQEHVVQILTWRLQFISSTTAA